MMERRRGWVVTFGSIGGPVRPRRAARSTPRPRRPSTSTPAAWRPSFGRTTSRSICIAPGGTVTPRFLATRQADPARLEATDTLERYADPIETARAVAFLVSDPGPFISGQIIRVDGGTQLWPA